MESPESLLALGKFAETVGTTALLVIAVWLLVKGAVVPRATVRDTMEHLAARYESAITELRGDVTELTAELAALRTAMVRCSVASKVLELQERKEEGP